MARIRTREIESLEALLLGLMKNEGIVTVHWLYSELLLSPASTVRALDRLLRLGYASRAEGMRGRKTAFVITDRGRERLQHRWRYDAAPRGSDAEEVLRFITLADLLGEEWQLERLPSLLMDIAATRRVRAMRIVAAARSKKESVVSRYGLWRALCEAGRMQGESEALDGIAHRLDRSAPEIYRKEDDVQGS